jgi:hypothetical protein
MSMTMIPSNPSEIASAGERIYEQKYKAQFEAQYNGKFVAVDVRSEQAFVGNSPEEALTKARQAHKDALVHLIKVGSAGAFRVSYAQHVGSNWLHK